MPRRRRLAGAPAGAVRVAIGRAGVRGNDRFLVSTRPTGEILLTPVACVPKRELLVWEDEELRASLLRGLADAAEGRVARRDDLLGEALGKPAYRTKNAKV